MKIKLRLCCGEDDGLSCRARVEGDRSVKINLAEMGYEEQIMTRERAQEVLSEPKHPKTWWGYTRVFLGGLMRLRQALILFVLFAGFCPIILAQGTPYTGGPYAVPGIVQAENYNVGSSAYHVCNTVNLGGAYRTDAVSIEATTDTGGGFDVAYVCPGDWENYTVNVAAGGLPIGTTVSVRVASLGPGGKMHLLFRNAKFKWVQLTRQLTIPNTNDWQSWTTVTTPTLIALPAGQRIIRVVYDTEVGNYVGNLNWFALGASSPPPTITVTPANATICLDMSGEAQTCAQASIATKQQYKAVDQNGNDISSQVTWSVSDPTIATISSTGLATAIAPGAVTITASHP